MFYRTLEDALNNREINSKLILHSDLGSQYTSKAYEKALKLNNIQYSFSRKECPYDNAGIESFHASLKKERVYQQEVYPDFETAKLDIFDYVLMRNSMNEIIRQISRKNCLKY